MTSDLVELELVAHVYAPLDGPHAAAALDGLHELWRRCRTELGMTQPIVEAELTADLPSDLTGRPDGAVAGLQDAAVQFQAIARREHDILNVSFGIAALDAVPGRRTRLAAAMPPGWREFTRWWRRLLAGQSDSLLGEAVVYLAKTSDATAVDLRAAVPEEDGDADRWWESGFTTNGFAAWETTPTGPSASRRLVMLAAPAEDAELSRFAWSDGGKELPPLGRYLMHAAKVRYQARVLDEGGDPARLRERVGVRLDEVTDRLRATGDPGRAGLIAADVAEVAGMLAALRSMRRTVRIAMSNMGRAVADPLPADGRIGQWLVERIGDEIEYLEAAEARVKSLNEVMTALPAAPPETRSVSRAGSPSAERSRRDPVNQPRVEHRVGFGIDIERYSSRTTPQQHELQTRLAGMLESVLARIGLPPEDTDRQEGGDGLMVVLPPTVEAHVALPKLLHGWRAGVVTDNAEHPEDRIRLRLSIGSGPFTPAAIGFSGPTIIEIGRLLDSRSLRQALGEHPDADVAAAVNDRLYGDVVVEGYPDLSAADFERFEVTVKSYAGSAWLWTGGAPRQQAARPERPKPAGREVFVIHGRDERARAAVFGLLRALDLRPLEWDEIVERTGKPAPYRDEVLNAGFAAGPGALVLLTPSDSAAGESDVLMRAGRALALEPDRTVIAMLGSPGPTGDLQGREIVRLETDDQEARTLFAYRIAARLRTVGFPVDTNGRDWLDPDRFRGLTSPSRADSTGQTH